MGPSSSTPTIIRITSATKFTERRSFTDRMDLSGDVPTPRRPFRQTDPDPKLIDELGPEDFGKRIVIRSGDFLGTIYGTLLGVHAHRNLVAFTTIQLWQKKELTLRNDTEVVVLDH